VNCILRSIPPRVHSSYAPAVHGSERSHRLDSPQRKSTSGRLFDKVTGVATAGLVDRIIIPLETTHEQQPSRLS